MEDWNNITTIKYNEKSYLFILVVYVMVQRKKKSISIEENIKIDSVNTLLEVVDSQKTSNNLPETTMTLLI